MNFINARVVRGEGGLWIQASGFKVKVPKEFEDKLANYIDKEIIFGIRPEDIYDKLFAIAPTPENTVTGIVDVVEPLGSETILHVRVGMTSSRHPSTRGHRQKRNRRSILCST